MQMPDRLKVFLQRWVISTAAALVATYMVPGIHYQRAMDLVVATFVLGILNTFARPLLLMLSLPLLILSLGFFTLFINAFLLFCVGLLLKPHFVVESFGAAFWGGLVITLISLVLNSLTGTGNARIEIQRRKHPPRRHPPRRRRPRDDDDGGPVIDI
jgi:putative membrane protein